MKNFLLKPFIEQFRKGDMTTFPMVYANFKKLIFFYANHLRYEDAAADITLFFIELLYVLNLSKFRSDDSESLERYIAVCLRNQYISLVKKSAKRLQNLLPLYEEAIPFYELYDEKIVLKEAFEKLSEKQKTVLLCKYIYGYNDNEIAQMMGNTRQTVNNIKNRAFEILQKYVLG